MSRTCRVCDSNISHRHKNAYYCVPCGFKKRLEAQREDAKRRYHEDNGREKQRARRAQKPITNFMKGYEGL